MREQGQFAMKKLRINKRALKTIARLYLVFGGYLLVFVIAFRIPFINEFVVIPFTSAVATASKIVMNIFGAGVTAYGNTLSTASHSIDVVDGCNGIYATAILISGVLAYPTKISYKPFGIIIGISAIFALNLVRVISLFYLGQYYPDIFEGFHIYVWQSIIIIWAIFVWDFWARKTDKRQEVV